MGAPELWHFRISHYNEKVRWALDYKQLPHTRRALIPGFHIPAVRKLTGQSKVPVLVLDGKTLKGSAEIVAELERLYPEPCLFPADPAEVERALALQAYFDREVAPDLRRLLWEAYFTDPTECARMATAGFGHGARVAFRAALPAMKPLFRRNMGMSADALAQGRARLPEYCARIESELDGRRYLVGDRFTIADLAVASIMSALIRPPEYPYPFPEPSPAAVTELRSSVDGTAGAEWVRAIYREHRSPSAEIQA